MKTFSLLLLILCSLSTYSLSLRPITGTIENVFCGEVNPYHVGDACIVYTTDESTGRKYGLVYDDYDWLDLHVPSDSSTDDMVGDRFQAAYCGKINSRGDIRELKDMDDSYFYLSCYVDGFNFFYGDTLGF